MILQLDEFGYIIGYATVGNIEGGVEVSDDTKIDLENYKNYQCKGGMVVLNPIPDTKPFNMAKPKYNGSKWVETATEDEIAELKQKFYTSELDLAGRARTEFSCDVITEQEYDEVKEYMRMIDPYRADSKGVSLVKRPEVFKRYK